MKSSRLALRFAYAWALFAAAAFVPSVLRSTDLFRSLGERPVVSHFIVKTLLLVFAIAPIAWRGSSERVAYGFCRPAAPVRWRRLLLAGAGCGAATTTLILLTPARGMTFLQEFGFVQLVLSIWIYSSIAEEIFVRGWFQGGAGAQSKSVVVASAILFGSMHLSLLWKGVDTLTVVIIVAGTTLLGWVAASARARYGSLTPPIAAHIAFNVAGLLIGIVINVIAIALHGQPIRK